MEELKTLIEDHGLKLAYIAKYLGISRQALRTKMLEERSWKPDEIKKLAELFNLSDSEIVHMFIKKD